MSLAQFIDHTILKNTTTAAEIEKICNEAMEYHFAAVCVPPCYVERTKKIIRRSSVKLATVTAFPFGYNPIDTKVNETMASIKHGADEIDMVINIGALKSNDWAYLEYEIEKVSNLVSDEAKILKVIIESSLLTDEEIIGCCNLYSRFPIGFLKTSTGFSDGGATVEAVKLMRKHLPAHIQIKASGGIRTAEFAQQLLDAGATRLGCSASIAIINGEKASGNY